MMNKISILLCLPILFGTFSESCLDGTTHRLISGSRYRVQDQFFEADSMDGRYTPDQARMEGESWCSNFQRASSAGPPWLQVTFGINVNITTIQIIRIFSNYFVTGFQVLIGDGIERSLHPVTESDDSTQPMVFVLSWRTGPVVNVTLPSPVTTQVLRIVPVKWTPKDGSACLKLEAFGCPVSPAQCQTEKLLTNDGVLLGSIIGSPSTPPGKSINYTIDDLVTTSDTAACTAGNLGSDPYFQLNFTSEVSLAYMEWQWLRGTPASNESRFRLEVQDESGDFNAYGITREPTIFSASDIKPFTFWRPVHGNTFRIYILNFTRGLDRFMCWNIKLYGCIMNTSYLPVDTISTRSNEEFSEASSNTTQEMNTGSTLGLPMLGGVVGGVVGLVILLAILLVIVVAAIFISRRRSTKVEYSESCKDTSEHKFNKSIYAEEIARPSSLQGDTREHTTVNSIYGNGEEFQTGYSLGKPCLPSSLPPNAYESVVPSTTAVPLQHSVVPESESIHHDPVYAICSGGDLNTGYHHLSRPSSLPPNTYEAVLPSSTTAVPIQHLNGTMGAQSDKMHYDPSYARYNAGPTKTEYHHLIRSDIPVSLSSSTSASVPSTTTAIYHELECVSGNHLTRSDIPASLSSSTSASVPSTTTAIYHELECVSGTVASHNDEEMINNPPCDKSS